MIYQNERRYTAMNVTKTYHSHELSYELGSARALSDSQKQALIRAFETPPEIQVNGLSGRIRPHVAPIGGFGRVVIKHYFRGGALRRINRRTYLKIGKTRGEAEFDMLNRVRRIGVSAPMPVAFASRPNARVFYHAWLATIEIAGAKTLADLSRSNPDRAMAVLPSVADQIDRLIRHRILHVDLHPGNVLVDADDGVYLVDFDKARTGLRTGMLGRRGIAAYYTRRWRRAVVKHGLPMFLNDLNG